MKHQRKDREKKALLKKQRNIKFSDKTKKWAKNTDTDAPKYRKTG